MRAISYREAAQTAINANEEAGARAGTLTDSLQGVVRGVVTTKMVVTTQGGVVTTLARGL